MGRTKVFNISEESKDAHGQRCSEASWKAQQGFRTAWHKSSWAGFNKSVTCRTLVPLLYFTTNNAVLGDACCPHVMWLQLVMQSLVSPGPVCRRLKGSRMISSRSRNLSRVLSGQTESINIHGYHYNSSSRWSVIDIRSSTAYFVVYYAALTLQKEYLPFPSTI